MLSRAGGDVCASLVARPGTASQATGLPRRLVVFGRRLRLRWWLRAIAATPWRFVVATLATTSAASVAAISAMTPIVASLAAIGPLHIAAHRCAGLDFAALLEGRLARKLHSPFVVDADALHPNHLANLRDVFGAVDPEISQLRNVHQAVLARENFDERAEFFDRNDATVIGLADFHFPGHAADDFFRARHALAAGRVDVHGAVVFDVNLRAGLGHDPLDRLAAGPDERADLLGIDFNRLDAGRVFAQRLTRLGEGFGHDGEDLGARIFRAMNRFAQNLVAHAGQLEIKLKTSDAVLRPAKFEIHVPEMIFGADDVGQEVVALQIAALVVLGHESDGNTGDRRLDGNARVHQREHAGANARHRGRAI